MLGRRASSGGGFAHVRGCWLVVTLPPWRIFATVVVVLHGCLWSCLLTLDNIVGGSALLSAGLVLRLAFRAVSYFVLFFLPHYLPSFFSSL
jgi:hypothetical protein